MIAPIPHKHTCICSVTHPHTRQELSVRPFRKKAAMTNEKILLMLQRVLSEFNQLFLLGRQHWY